MLSKICCSPVKVGKEQQNAKNKKKSPFNVNSKRPFCFGRKFSMAQKTLNHPKRTPQPRHQEVAAKDPSSHILARDPFKKDPQHGSTAFTAFPKEDTKKYKSW